LLSNAWFRNTGPGARISDADRPQGTAIPNSVVLSPALEYGKRWLLAAGQPEMIFTENEN